MCVKYYIKTLQMRNDIVRLVEKLNKDNEKRSEELSGNILTSVQRLVTSTEYNNTLEIIKKLTEILNWHK